MINARNALDENQQFVEFIHSDSPPTTDWQQVVGVRENDGTLNLYIDGILQSTPGTKAGAIVCTDGLRMGLDQANTYDYSGQIDIPMMWNRALSAAEIALLYRESFCMFKDPAEIALLGGYQAAVGGIPILRRRRECA